MVITCASESLCPSCDDDKLVESDDGIVCFSCGEIYADRKDLKPAYYDWSPMGLNSKAITEFRYFETGPKDGRDVDGTSVVQRRRKRSTGGNDDDVRERKRGNRPPPDTAGVDERGAVDPADPCGDAPVPDQDVPVPGEPGDGDGRSGSDRCEGCSVEIRSTREGDVVCVDCGRVLASGCDLFHFGRLHDAAYTYRKGTYRIKYYFNEKLAQWCRQCPVPDDPTFEAFVREARNVGKYGRPKDFGRGDIAKMCKAIGRPTMQEKWLLLMEMLVERDPGYFGAMTIPPKPRPRLVNEVRRLFHHSLPAWNMCKDIEISGDGGYVVPAHYRKLDVEGKKKRRKSYPHNYMIRRFLQQIQLWYEDKDDPDLRGCYDSHEQSIKRVSENIEMALDVVWTEMSRTMNDAGFTLTEH